MVSLKGATVSLPTVAIAQFERFFDQGRAVVGPCTRVLHGFQGADCSVEQHGLTDAAFGELGVVARGQPSLFILMRSSLL